MVVAPRTFRLDTLAANLVARLEAVRRAHVDRPADAAAAFAATTREATTAVAAECRSTLGDEGQAHLLESEAVASFLPRYTALAVAQSRDEATLRLGGIVGQVLGRAAGVVVGALGWLLLDRIAPGPWGVVLMALPPAMLFWPDLLLAVWRRRFANQLQELVDDLGRLQEAHADLAPPPEPAPVRPRSTGQEMH